MRKAWKIGLRFFTKVPRTVFGTFEQRTPERGFELTKPSFIPWGLRVLIWKRNLCSRFLQYYFCNISRATRQTISDLIGSFRSRYPGSVENEKASLALKSTELVISSVLSALLTRKLLMFLSRLYDVSGGREKMVAVSGLFWRSLKFLRMMLITARLLGWKVTVNEILSLFYAVLTRDRW